MPTPGEPSQHEPLPPVPVRDRAGHKGTFGTVAIVGGCAGPGVRMIGAPALAALGALRAGAGLVRLVMPAPVLDAGLIVLPSATGVPLATDRDGAVVPHLASQTLDEQFASCRCLVVGPGLGRGDGPRTASLRAVQQEETPVVLDADAINALAEIPELHRDFRAAAILTPHPGEFRRLAATLRISHDPGQPGSRREAAAALAQRLGCVVVLKGAGTVVSDGVRTWTNGTGNAALATAGTGDVLSGVLAGLVAQFAAIPGTTNGDVAERFSKPLDLYDAARLAVWAHGAAAERWVQRRGASAGLLAAELAGEVPGVLWPLDPMADGPERGS